VTPADGAADIVLLSLAMGGRRPDARGRRWRRSANGDAVFSRFKKTTENSKISVKF
jgi:hypothetical protein